jgi:hypothetical protein
MPLCRVTMSSRIASSLLLALASLSACSESHEAADNEIRIMFDLGPDLAADDAGTTSPLPAERAVGASCDGDEDCDTSDCITDFEDGYCSLDCADDDDVCPDGSVCIGLNRTQSFCLDACDPIAETRECRPGYGCALVGDGAGVCLPGCSDASDCPSGACDTSDGQGGACYSPDAVVGAACTDDVACPLGGFCFSEAFAGWPGGACVLPNCDAVAGVGCTEDSACLANGDSGICIRTCTAASDCREGYACVPVADGSSEKVCQAGCTADTQCTIAGHVCNVSLGTCAPPFDPSSLGGACSAFSGVGCEGGSCIGERGNGFPGGYCAYYGCDTEAADADDGCPSDGVCTLARDGETTYCLDGCTRNEDCRGGYACEPRIADRPESTGGCKPRCTSDTQCMSRNSTCNVTTGRCEQ